MMKRILVFLFSLPKTIFFNFYHLPFKQAIKFPIWLFYSLKGKVIIDSDIIKSGMIKLGPVANPLYDPDHYFTWENKGIIRFKGTCIIGHASGLSTGKNGCIEFGDNFLATVSIKIISFENIKIGRNVRIAWDSIIMDTDFHETIDVESGVRSTPTKPIIIGNNSWLGIRSLILKGTRIPDYSIVGAHTILNKKYTIPEYSIFAGTPPRVMKSGVYRDLNSYVE